MHNNTALKTIPRRVASLAVSLVLGASALMSTTAMAQDVIPSGSVSITVAYAPGGGTDLMARTLQGPFSEALGHSVVVENRPGGGTIVGTQHVINAAPNGRTLLYGTNATLLNQVLRGYDEYDPITDLAHVGVVATQSLGILIHPSLGIDSVEELVEYARANPGEINFASSGNASLQHIAGEMLKSAANIDITHIPYTGAGPAMTDLVTGRADMMITSLLGTADYLASGQLKLIATTGPERTAARPDVPTVAEAGYPDYAAVSYQAVYAPKGTSPEIINQLNQALRTAATDELTAEILDRGLELRITSPEEMTEFLKNEAETYGRIIDEVGLSL